MLKSDHLLSFLKRSAKVTYQTEPIELPKLASTGPVPMDREAYWLAKAQASMVLVQCPPGNRWPRKEVPNDPLGHTHGWDAWLHSGSSYWT